MSKSSSVVAVAGGTGSLGRTIVKELVSSGKFTVYVLGRKADPEKEKSLGCKILPVDYSDRPSLIKILEDNNIDTVLSTVQSTDGPDPEITLSEAAEKSRCTRRFIPAIWGCKCEPEFAKWSPFIAERIQVLEALSETSLEWTSVHNGYFADYFVGPGVTTNFDRNTVPCIDAHHDFAAIPGSGEAHAVFTHTTDVAKFMPHLLASEEKWERESNVIGQRLTLHQVVAKLEAIKGTKFTVVYDPVDKLEKGEITELPCHKETYGYFPKEVLQPMFAGFGLMFERGVLDVDTQYDLGRKFPDVKARSFDELINEGWASASG